MGDTVLNFGKFKGKTYAEVLHRDRSYCDYVLANAHPDSAATSAFSKFAHWVRKNIAGLSPRFVGNSNCTFAASELTHCAAFQALLPSLESVCVETVHVAMTRPTDCTPQHFGTFLDYTVRHYLCARKGIPFEDSRANHETHQIAMARELRRDFGCDLGRELGGAADKLLDTPCETAYARVQANPDTRAVLRDLFFTSLLHSASFREKVYDVTFSEALSPASLSPLFAFLDTLPLDALECNPCVGSAGLLRGDADLLLGSTLIDVKCCKNAPAMGDLGAWTQLFLYAALLFHTRAGFRACNLQIYNPLLGCLATLDVSKWHNHEAVVQFLRDTIEANDPGAAAREIARAASQVAAEAAAQAAAEKFAKNQIRAAKAALTRAANVAAKAAAKAAKAAAKRAAQDSRDARDAQHICDDADSIEQSEQGEQWEQSEQGEQGKQGKKRRLADEV